MGGLWHCFTPDRRRWYPGGAWLTAMEPRIRLTEAAQALRQ